MCGIAGVFNPDPAYPVDPSVVRSMTDILSHRGPDQQGLLTAGGIGLGHRRLSIIDLSGGKQPLHNEDKTVWVVFNGEIFNYPELTEFLKAKGHRFLTRSDTEVIVHMYEEFGDSFVDHFVGQFAIAIWDSRTRQLVLARDRVGIRPLYYTELDDGTVVFGSEMKALFCHPAVCASLDPVGLEQVFTLWVTVPPTTIFKNIRELKPGCLCRFDHNGSRLHRYWKPSFPDKGDYDHRPLDWYCDRVREVLHDAVRLRLRADVPVAAYLSGGLDSSIIAALVKKYHVNDLVTFSVGFDDTLYDERVHQNVMAAALQTDHRAITVDYDGIGKLFGDVVWYAESPMIRTAPAPLFALSGLVRRSGIKVILTGEGADEVFGGYNIFKENRVRRFWARNPGSRLRPLLLSRLYPYIHAAKGHDPLWQMFFRKGLTDTSDPYYSHRIRWANTARLKRFFTKELSDLFDHQRNVEAQLDAALDPDMARWDPLCQAQYLEMTLFMSGYLLSSQGDRMMMGHSVEGRFPFLDHRLIELAATIPPGYKLNILNEKYILKRAYAGLVPDSVIGRAKQPYRAPIDKCFGAKSRTLARAMIEPGPIARAGVFDQGCVAALTSKIEGTGGHLSATDDMAVAAVVSTQLLWHHFVAQGGPPHNSEKPGGHILAPQADSPTATP